MAGFSEGVDSMRSEYERAMFGRRVTGDIEPPNQAQEQQELIIYDSREQAQAQTMEHAQEPQAATVEPPSNEQEQGIDI